MFHILSNISFADACAFFASQPSSCCMIQRFCRLRVNMTMSRQTLRGQTGLPQQQRGVEVVVLRKLRSGVTTRRVA